MDDIRKLVKLDRDDNGLFLSCDGMTVRGDFVSMARRISKANLERELIVKAAKIKGLGDNPRAVDATAGLGEDAFLLAAAGFSVTMYERDEIIGALLEDALERARALGGHLPAEAGALGAELAASVVVSRGRLPVGFHEAIARMELKREDSIEALKNLSYRPDVVLLDPMFPERKKSALVKKKLQLIQQLEAPCDDEEALMEAAIGARPKRIIVKRPPKGPYLAGVKPSFSLTGKAVRIDCIVLPD